MYRIEVDNLIVGGGASGLSIAARLRDQANTLIVTKDVGGLIRSFDQYTFSFDYGGHVYSATRDDVVDIMKACNGTFFEQREAFYLLDNRIDGKRAAFPVQSSGAFEIRPQSLAWLPTKYNGSLEDWAEFTFGPNFVREFFKPFNERVWQTSIDRMSCDWITNRVQQPSQEEGKRWGSNASFWYAPGSKVISQLRSKTAAILVLGEVTTIDFENKEAITFVDGVRAPRIIKYNNIFVTIPQFGFTTAAGMTCIGIGFKKPVVEENFHWVYPHISSPVHRITLLSRYHSDLAPAGKQSLLFEIPGKGRIDRSEALAIAMTQSGITLDPEDVETIWTHHETFSMPVQTMGLRSKIAVAKYRFKQYGAYFAGRWGAHGYWNLQDIFDDAEAVVDYVESRKRGSEDAYFNSNFYYT